MRAALIGATGFTGGFLLEWMLRRKDFGAIRILTRQPVERQDPRLEKWIVDFNQADQLRQALAGADIILCAMGTTLKKVKGDKALYRRIDHDIAVNAAALGRQGGCHTFILMSSVGASPSSRNFYLRLKGETEKDVQEAGIPSLYILRPSLLTGPRKEFRLAEKLAMKLMPLLSWSFPANYKPVPADTVAKAMYACALQREPGCHILHYPAILSAARRVDNS